jgi:hypothetical protein
MSRAKSVVVLALAVPAIIIVLAFIMRNKPK